MGFLLISCPPVKAHRPANHTVCPLKAPGCREHRGALSPGLAEADEYDDREPIFGVCAAPAHRACLNIRLPAPRLALSVYFPRPDQVKRGRMPDREPPNTSA